MNDTTTAPIGPPRRVWMAPRTRVGLKPQAVSAATLQDSIVRNTLSSRATPSTPTPPLPHTFSASSLPTSSSDEHPYGLWYGGSFSASESSASSISDKAPPPVKKRRLCSKVTVARILVGVAIFLLIVGIVLALSVTLVKPDSSIVKSSPSVTELDAQRQIEPLLRPQEQQKEPPDEDEPESELPLPSLNVPSSSFLVPQIDSSLSSETPASPPVHQLHSRSSQNQVKKSPAGSSSEDADTHPLFPRNRNPIKSFSRIAPLKSHSWSVPNESHSRPGHQSFIGQEWFEMPFPRCKHELPCRFFCHDAPKELRPRFVLENGRLKRVAFNGTHIVYLDEKSTRSRPSRVALSEKLSANSNSGESSSEYDADHESDCENNQKKSVSVCVPKKRGTRSAPNRSPVNNFSTQDDDGAHPALLTRRESVKMESEEWPKLRKEPGSRKMIGQRK